MNAELQGYIEARERTLLCLKSLLIEKLHVRREPNEIDPDSPLFGTGLGLDSVDAVELVVSLEAELRVRLPQDALARPVLRTLGTLADYVMRTKEAS